ncbi:MAG: tRNA pseudouridine(38-40) synthase TruA [Bacteroidales bacterium]
MSRYFIKLAFKGTKYHGWQIQEKDITIQEVINKAIGTILREDINVIGAGRTDTGVHASCFYAHFDSNKTPTENRDHFLFKINNYLPKDIAIYDIFPVPDKAHSRYSAKSRTYKYYISKIKNPFKNEFSYYLFYHLDTEIMNQACNILYEYSDFTSFSKKNTQVKTNLCEIYHASWQEDTEEIVFTIQADRFLRNMVRAIVGTMIDLGRGKINIKQFRDIIESKDRCRAGYSVPPNGLFLTDITYPDSVFSKR